MLQCIARKDTSIIHLEDILMLAAMGPPGGGRNHVTHRLLRHFNIVSIDTFDEATMQSIFTPIIDWHFNNGFDVALKRFSRVSITLHFHLCSVSKLLTSLPLLQIIIGATLDIFQQAIANFLPTPSKSHYLFNLRDFSRVVQVRVHCHPTCSCILNMC